MPILVIKKLTKSYNGKKVIGGLDLTVNENEIAIVMGKSGSGKTTLLLCLLGFVVPEAGEIKTEYTYNNSGMLTSKKVDLNGDTAEILYEYDNVDERYALNSAAKWGKVKKV